MYKFITKVKKSKAGMGFHAFFLYWTCVYRKAVCTGSCVYCVYRKACKHTQVSKSEIFWSRK